MRIERDLPYRPSLPRITGGECCVLDLYLPPDWEDSGMPLHIWFHGGGLSGGTRLEGAPLAEMLARHGIATALVGYRFSPAFTFPAYLEDAAEAVAWAYRSAAEWRFDSRKITFGGYSAGGYIAAMLTMDERYLRAAGLSELPAASVIHSAQVSTHFQVRHERGLPAHSLLVDESAPLHFCREATLPFLLYVGGCDIPGRLEENRLFARQLELAGNQHFGFYELPGLDHAQSLAHLCDDQNEPTQRMIAFLKRQTGVI